MTAPSGPTRRHVLIGMLSTAALGMVGCSPIGDPTPSPTGSSSPAAPTASPGPEPSESPEPDPIPEDEPAPALPSRADIVEEFSHLTPREWGMEVPGIVLAVQPGTALTLDACGGPYGSDVDWRILDLLMRHEVPATLFLNSRWIEANRDLAHDLAAVPFFLLANHGTSHKPLSVTGQGAYGIAGTASVGEVYDEVAVNHELLGELTGTAPTFFRAGTAHMDEVAVAIVRALGEVPVNFTVNVDAGATANPDQVGAVLAGAGDGDICLAHMNQPEAPAGAGWEWGLEQLLDSGAHLATLAELDLLLPPTVLEGWPRS